MELLSILGQKTTIAGLSMVGLGIYQLTQGDIEAGIKTISEGFGLMFLRQAITKQKG